MGTALETPIRGEVRISVRNLVEFILRSGDIDNRKKGGGDLESMLEGARIHRMIQKRMGSDYHAEVMLRQAFPQEDFDIVIEGRADGIIYKDHFSDGVTIDEIKSTWKDVERLLGPEPVHLAQAKCYAYMFSAVNKLPEITVRMTYVNILNQQLRYFHETYTAREIEAWFQALFESYKKWAVFEYKWKRLRNETAEALTFPFAYREGQKELA
ncbi:MAG: ATP-dependent DNA helicase, partial [Lachnospiraceae bacterium]|nr:ATP-dependent DNA helicase [Lachnospiraceae bacterium]